MSEHPLFGVPDDNWWLHRGQRMIRGGLVMTVPFALGRPLELVVERAEGPARRETAMEEYEA